MRIWLFDIQYGYLTPEIDPILRNQLRPPPLQTETQDQPSPHFLHLPYVRGISERIERAVGNLGLGQPSSLEEHSAKSWYRQRSHNQHGRKDELCSRYPLLNANACTLEKLKECWRKDWAGTKEQSKGMTQTMHEIAVHTWKTQRKVDWEAATVKQVRQTTHEGLLKLYTSERKK